jgi:magnesium-transporting ATPase (P-type)
MATLHRTPDGGRMVCIKGAPEALLPLARDADRALWEKRIAEAAAKGERILAFARQTPAAGVDRLVPADLEAGVDLLGIMGFIDPPRAEAEAAVAECRRAGIAVKMITGDHELTAIAIARQLTLADEPVSLTGAAIDGMSDDELGARAAGATVFARATPEHKLRIVRALQAGGAIVAMTGDGVNDSPSLKAADVGIAMGRNGTAAAREAAQLVLLDDNFATIVSAVHEGRTVYDNIRKLIGWMLPTDGGEVIGVILAILLGFAMPISATQILWVNLVTSVTLGLAVAFEPSEPGVMSRPPRDPKAPLLSPFMLWRLALVSALMGAASIGMFFWTLDTGGDPAMARTMAVNMVVTAETFYLFNIRRLHRTTLGLGGMPRSPVMFWCVILIVVAQALFTYAPFMQDIFGTRSLRPEQLLLIFGVSLGLTLFLELEKLFMRWTGWFPELRRPV